MNTIHLFIHLFIYTLSMHSLGITANGKKASKKQDKSFKER